MWDDWFEEESKNKKMDSKNKHPFAITCRKCGSNRVAVIPYEYGDLGIKCEDCGKFINCGTYYTYKCDYSNM